MAEKKVTADNLLNEVINSDHAAMQEMLDLQCPINVVGTCGEAPLHIAIYKRDERMLHILMEAGADLMYRNQNGDTALHVAARMGLAHFTELLYSTATELNKKRLFLQAKNKEGQTALDIALERVRVTELDLTRLYCSWDSESGTTLDEEAGPLQVGRDKCARFLQEKIDVDIRSKQIGSVQEMVSQNNDFQKTAGVLRGNHFASSSSRVFYSELDYPARLDKNAWVDSDRQFFLEYLPGVRQVITKLHAADFVTKTMRSGLNNAQLIIRKNEISAYMQEQARLREESEAPPEAERVPTDSVETLRRRAKGRKDFSLAEQSAEFKSYYINTSSYGSEDVEEKESRQEQPSKVPKTVEQLRSDVAAEEERTLEAKRQIDEYHRPPMRAIFASALQAESGGVGRMEEGLFQVKPNNTHGQPAHTFEVLPPIDPRFQMPRDVPTDDRVAAQTNVLLTIDKLALGKMQAARKKSEQEFSERKEQLDADTDAYNNHMRIKGAMYKL